MKYTRRVALTLGVISGATGLDAPAAPPPVPQSPPPAPLAVISALEGAAVVSLGNDIMPALAGMELRPLNRVFVLDGGKATIQFNDRCERELSGDTVLTITAEDMCAAADEIERGAQSVADPAGASPQSSFAAAAGAPSKTGPLLFPGLGAGVGANAALAVGGTVAAGGLVWAITDDDDDDSPPPPLISPQ